MQPMPSMGYDRAITVFSPDGRLFQVEYAREAVKRGTTSVGIKCTDGIVLAVDKRVSSRLVEAPSVEKIYQIDDHIAAATCGLVADARVLVDRARVEAQVNKITYNEPIDVTILVKKICDFKQLYTQHGGVRPFGVALLVGGITAEPRLFETDPSGALIEYKATAIGSGRNVVMEIFEEKYKDNIRMDGAIDLALEALYKATEEKISETTVEIATIDAKTKTYRKLPVKEVAAHVAKAIKKGSSSKESGKG
ncbi:MAG: archaeal proteasome endopeptidase complex subunit alpha [Methanobacteriota archaeon]|nr:MAG: archaeal proteasome endopeptidase complex subunit alpha [Euryarchaeota archaeon]